MLVKNRHDVEIISSHNDRSVFEMPLSFKMIVVIVVIMM